MPRETPDTAEMMKPTDSSTMITISALLLSLSMPPTIEMPDPICMAPTPRDAAVPKRVAKIAKTSISLPMVPSTRLWPSSAVNTREISGARPRR